MFYMLIMGTGGAETIGMEDDMITFYRSVDNKRDIVRARVNDLFDVLKKELMCVNPLTSMTATYY